MTAERYQSLPLSLSGYTPARTSYSRYADRRAPQGDSETAGQETASGSHSVPPTEGPCPGGGSESVPQPHFSQPAIDPAVQVELAALRARLDAQERVIAEQLAQSAREREAARVVAETQRQLATAVSHVAQGQDHFFGFLRSIGYAPPQQPAPQTVQLTELGQSSSAAAAVQSRSPPAPRFIVSPVVSPLL